MSSSTRVHIQQQLHQIMPDQIPPAVVGAELQGGIYAGVMVEDGKLVHLIRAKESIGEANWDEAQVKAREYRGGGLDDWYLPSKMELLVVLLHEPGGLGSDWHWSSTPVTEGTAWVVDLREGGVDSTRTSTLYCRSTDFNVLPFRRFVQSFIPAIGQPWPEQGGVYIGSRLIDGQTHHIIIPGGPEHDIKASHNNAAERIAARGEINGFCDWRHGSREDLMLAQINAPGLFVRRGPGSMQVTSSPYCEDYAYVVDFEGGYVTTAHRSTPFCVRPVRYVCLDATHRLFVSDRLATNNA